eukprot:scaffold743_cov267-Pinguiococcus_pyrenoidosus.AAC.10
MLCQSRQGVLANDRKEVVVPGPQDKKVAVGVHLGYPRSAARRVLESLDELAFLVQHGEHSVLRNQLDQPLVRQGCCDEPPHARQSADKVQEIEGLRIPQETRSRIVSRKSGKGEQVRNRNQLTWSQVQPSSTFSALQSALSHASECYRRYRARLWRTES